MDALEKGSMISMNKPLNKRVEITMAIFNKIKRRKFKIPPIIFSNEDIIVTGENSDLLMEIGIVGKIIHTPGHTVDSISVILKNGDAFVGDICINFLNFCSIHYRPIWFYDPGLVFESWRKIIDNGTQTIYPAHGRSFAVEGLIRYEKHYKTRSTVSTVSN